MNESNFRFRKNFSMSHKQTKEEKEKELSSLPKNIGPYEIIEKLKDGGYSRVFKAKSCYTGEFVAIKLIDKMSFQESVEDVLLMIRQTEVLKILKHRNLVTLYEIYESTKYFYLIMDYLPNGDLMEKIIKKKRFKEEEALSIFSQLVDALYYMHKNDICHRDIRTEKILFDKNNKPKLVGFSYSTFYTQGKKIRDSYGSLCYACPEIIQNDYYNPELADVWSLGVVLYVMICGYLPFSEDDDGKNKELIINGEVDYPPEVSNKAKDLLKHMLDVNPNKRYNFQRIIKHPWFKPYNESTLTGGCNIYKMIYPIDERILKIIVIYGFNKKIIDMDLKQNKFNSGTGLYKQLTDKFLGMGFTSFSDLCSDDFMEFKKDKENIITDGDKTYKKYITKILEKIKKVERYVNEYKRKEDKIVRDLESIYADAEAEEMEKRKKEMELMKLNNKKNMGNNNYNRVKTYQNEKKNENFNPKNFQRRTMSPMLTIKDQKGLKNYLASKIANNKKDKNQKNNNILTINFKNYEDINDFDILKDFEANNKLNEINNIFEFDEEDEKCNNKKLKRYPSNPNIKEFVKKLIEKEDDDYNLYSSRKMMKDNNNEFDMKLSKRKRQLSVMIKKKKRNYLSSSSINDSILRKPRDGKERKRRIKDNLINSINQVIIEENINEANADQNNEENNNDNNDFKLSFNDDGKDKYSIKEENSINDSPTDENKDENNKENHKVETKKTKNLRYSLSFGEDDEELDEEIGFSKIESKQVSMYDIDEELKELKEIKNTLKSPACGPYLKPNTSDNKLFNFDIDNNNTIFGEHLDDNNITNNTNETALAHINENIDILTELKKLTERNSTEVAKLNDDKNKQKIENNQFKDESFGESQNYKREYSPIVFDDQLEISFHEENNNNSNKKDNDTLKNNSNRNLNIYTSNYNNTTGFNNNISTATNARDDMIGFYKDIKKIKKMKKFNKTEELMLCVSNLDSKRKNKFCFNYLIDSYFCKKINFFNINDDLSINIIESKRNKKNKNENEENIMNKKFVVKLPIKLNDEGNEEEEEEEIKKRKKKINKKKILENQINSSIENMNNMSLSINTNIINDTPTNIINSNMNTIDKSELINPLMYSQDNQDNFINCFNNNDNEKQKIYIIDKIDNFDNSCNENDSQKNENNRTNNIIINSNNNTINNISINNKNNYGNYYQQNTITNNNYYDTNNNDKNTTNVKDKNSSKNIPNKLDWSNWTNLFKKEKNNDDKNLYTFYEKEKKSKNIIRNENKLKKELCPIITDKTAKYKTNKKTTNYSSIYNNTSLNNTITTKNRNVSIKFNKIDLKGKQNLKERKKDLPKSLTKNWNLKEKPKKAPINKVNNKKNNNNISVQKTLHFNLMSNDFEKPEDKNELISKIKKGQKIYQYVISDNKPKTSKKIDYSKFIQGNANEKNINDKNKKEKTNYTQQYHKKMNSNINCNVIKKLNNNNKKENKEQSKHNYTKSDIINYDYVFSIYNEINKNKNSDNSISRNNKKFHEKHQSMDTYLENDIREEDENSFEKNEFDENNFFSNKKQILNLRYGIGNDFSTIEKNE